MITGCREGLQSMGLQGRGIPAIDLLNTIHAKDVNIVSRPGPPAKLRVVEPFIIVAGAEAWTNPFKPFRFTCASASGDDE